MAHDKGIVNLRIVSTSLSQAINQVLSAERAPLSAVRYAKRIREIPSEMELSTGQA